MRWRSLGLAHRGHEDSCKEVEAGVMCCRAAAKEGRRWIKLKWWGLCFLGQKRGGSFGQTHVVLKSHTYWTCTHSAHTATDQTNPDLVNLCILSMCLSSVHPWGSNRVSAVACKSESKWIKRRDTERKRERGWKRERGLLHDKPDATKVGEQSCVMCWGEGEKIERGGGQNLPAQPGDTFPPASLFSSHFLITIDSRISHG